MHKMYPPDGFKGERYSDKYGDFVRTKSGAYTIENSSENMGFDKEIERIELTGKSKMTKINKVENSATSIGIVSDFNERLVSGVKNAGGYAKVLGRIGMGIGGFGAGVSIYNAIKNPTTGNILRATISTTTLVMRVNLAIGFILGVSDITGFSDYIYNKIDKR